MLQVKICGITQVEQGSAIAHLGSTALGYICVAKSPRYVTPEQIAPITAAVADECPNVQHFGVFADESVERMVQITRTANLTTLQLHGNETPERCQQLRNTLKTSGFPDLKIVKALRIRDASALNETKRYEPYVDALLLDAYHPDQLGGTGKTLDWQALRAFSPGCPWFLAGGLSPDNICDALSQLSPSGIDLSSGVERSPGVKDLQKVRQLFEQVKHAEIVC